LAIGCSSAPVDVPAVVSHEANSTVAVSIVTPQRTAIHREVSQPGAIEAFEETPVFAKVAGYVKEGWKDRGDTLRKGEVLAELWVPELEVELRRKEALLRQARSEIEQARRAVSAAEAAFHSAEAKVAEAEAKRLAAQARYNRMKSQYDRLAQMQQVVNKENIEEAQLGFETARANLAEAEAAVKFARAFQDESKAGWSKSEADLTVADDHLEVARHESDYAKTMLNYARLTAPYDCIVTQRHINTGDFVQTAAAGKDKPLYVVHRMDLMRIFVQVPESDVPWVKKGVEARVRVQVLPGRIFAGHVARTSWSVDPATRTLRAEIDLPNADGLLRPGLYAYATVSADVPDLLTLPRSAVKTEGEVTRGYKNYCFQVEDDKVRRLPVELGAGDSAHVEVMKKRTRPDGPWEPFSGTEQIVQNYLTELRDGQQVTLRAREP
jgi:RND family efflux transporter MFP subunit